MWNRMKLRTKIFLIGGILTVVPLLTVSILSYFSNAEIGTIASQNSVIQADTDLEHIAGGILGMCDLQEKMLNSTLDTAIDFAWHEVGKLGEASLSKDTVEWQAVNQYTKQSQAAKLPKFEVGTTWLGQNTQSKVPSPVVDSTGKLLRCTCTIFQKLNNNGDMLRIATNIIGKDGSRAVGTYIPAVNPDGKANPVISRILAGQTFEGRAFVVDRWYMSTYQPMYNKNKELIGMLYVGVPMESLKTVMAEIQKVKVGKTGYVFVLDSKGNYVISKDNKRDGENIWDSQDANGRFFIRDMCNIGVNLKEGELGEIRYSWKNPGEADARDKITKIAYFKSLDWVIGVGAYEDDFFEARDAIISAGNRGTMQVLAIAGISLVVSIVVWFLVSSGLIKKITQVITILRSGAEQTSQAASQIAQASQSLASGSSEQAASLEETSASIEEMTSMIKGNVTNIASTDELATVANDEAQKGSEAMSRMLNAIEDIRASSDETSKIIRAIDDIAFQTNLLALNAAVEAARAGEAGKGFAVVADEVRNLSQRSAQAAKDTSRLIEESVKKSERGVEISQEVSKSLDNISQGAKKVSVLVKEIAMASQEQAQGIEQINTAVIQMDTVTQSNAANAEETASASEELSAQTQELNMGIVDLESLINGSAARKGNQNEPDFRYQKTSGKSERSEKPQSMNVTRTFADKHEETFVE